jgi:hypothetical protein
MFIDYDAISQNALTGKFDSVRRNKTGVSGAATVRACILKFQSEAAGVGRLPSCTL